MNPSFGDIYDRYQKLTLTTHLPAVIACSETLSLGKDRGFIPQPGYLYFLLQGQMTLAFGDEQNFGRDCYRAYAVRITGTLLSVGRALLSVSGRVPAGENSRQRF